MATCINHPIKMATARCKTCNKPLCNECKKMTDIGIFCSPECEAKTRNFQEKAGGGSVTYKKRFFTKRNMGALVVLALLIVGVGAFLQFWLGIETVDDLKRVLASWWEARLLLIPW